MKTSLRLAGLTLLSTTAIAGIGAIAACSSTSSTANADGGTPTKTTNPDASMSTNPDGSMNNPTSGPITSCTTATLFAGDPTREHPDNGSERPTDGTGILADPPFQWGNLTYNGSTLYTRDTGEVWYVDTSAAAPVEKHLLGSNGGNQIDITFGACTAARVGAIQGMVILKDGSIVATDAFANDIIHIVSPTDPKNCKVESWAGTNASTSFTGTSYPNIGDVDGPVGTSKIEYPVSIAFDGNDTIYFFDSGKGKVKKLFVSDTTHAVTSIGKLPGNEDISYGAVNIGSTIYMLGYDGTVTNVYKIVGTAISKVAGGGTDAWPDLRTTPQIGGITTDGTNIITAGQGFMWLVNVTSGAITHIAGSGERVDLNASGYDAKASHPALDVVLKPQSSASEAAVGSPDYLAFKDGAVYYRGHGGGTASYVEKVQCQ